MIIYMQIAHNKRELCYASIGMSGSGSIMNVGVLVKS